MSKESERAGKTVMTAQPATYLYKDVRVRVRVGVRVGVMTAQPATYMEWKYETPYYGSSY